MANLVNSIQQFDFTILNYIWMYCHTDWLDSLMVNITMIGDSGIIWILIGIYLLWHKAYRKTGLAIIIALVLGFIICNLGIKPLVGRVRPFEFQPALHLLINAPHGYSFPSGHTWSAFAMATILILAKFPGCYWTLGLAFVIGFSRIYLYVHYPTDVLAGAILGFLIGAISFYVLRHFTTNQFVFSYDVAKESSHRE